MAARGVQFVEEDEVVHIASGRREAVSSKAAVAEGATAKRRRRRNRKKQQAAAAKEAAAKEAAKQEEEEESDEDDEYFAHHQQQQQEQRRQREQGSRQPAGQRQRQKRGTERSQTQQTQQHGLADPVTLTIAEVVARGYERRDVEECVNNMWESGLQYDNVDVVVAQLAMQQQRQKRQTAADSGARSGTASTDGVRGSRHANGTAAENGSFCSLGGHREFDRDATLAPVPATAAAVRAGRKNGHADTAADAYTAGGAFDVDTTPIWTGPGAAEPVGASRNDDEPIEVARSDPAPDATAAAPGISSVVEKLELIATNENFDAALRALSSWINLVSDDDVEVFVTQSRALEYFFGALLSAVPDLSDYDVRSGLICLFEQCLAPVRDPHRTPTSVKTAHAAAEALVEHLDTVIMQVTRVTSLLGTHPSELAPRLGQSDTPTAAPAGDSSGKDSGDMGLQRQGAYDAMRSLSKRLAFVVRQFRARERESSGVLIELRRYDDAMARTQSEAQDRRHGSSALSAATFESTSPATGGGAIHMPEAADDLVVGNESQQQQQQQQPQTNHDNSVVVDEETRVNIALSPEMADACDGTSAEKMGGPANRQLFVDRDLEFRNMELTYHACQLACHHPWSSTADGPADRERHPTFESFEPPRSISDDVIRFSLLRSVSDDTILAQEQQQANVVRGRLATLRTESEQKLFPIRQELRIVGEKINTMERQRTALLQELDALNSELQGLHDRQAYLKDAATEHTQRYDEQLAQYDDQHAGLLSKLQRREECDNLVSTVRDLEGSLERAVKLSWSGAGERVSYESTRRVVQYMEALEAYSEKEAECAALLRDRLRLASSQQLHLSREIQEYESLHMTTLAFEAQKRLDVLRQHVVEDEQCMASLLHAASRAERNMDDTLTFAKANLTAPSQGWPSSMVDRIRRNIARVTGATDAVAVSSMPSPAAVPIAAAPVIGGQGNAETATTTPRVTLGQPAAISDLGTELQSPPVQQDDLLARLSHAHHEQLAREAAQHSMPDSARHSPAAAHAQAPASAQASAGFPGVGAPQREQGLHQVAEHQASMPVGGLAGPDTTGGVSAIARNRAGDETLRNLMSWASTKPSAVVSTTVQADARSGSIRDIQKEELEGRLTAENLRRTQEGKRQVRSPALEKLLREKDTTATGRSNGDESGVSTGGGSPSTPTRHGEGRRRARNSSSGNNSRGAGPDGGDLGGIDHSRSRPTSSPQRDNAPAASTSETSPGTSDTAGREQRVRRRARNASTGSATSKPPSPTAAASSEAPP